MARVGLIGGQPFETIPTGVVESAGSGSPNGNQSRARSPVWCVVVTRSLYQTLESVTRTSRGTRADAPEAAAGNCTRRPATIRRGGGYDAVCSPVSIAELAELPVRRSDRYRARRHDSSDRQHEQAASEPRHYRTSQGPTQQSGNSRQYVPLTPANRQPLWLVAGSDNGHPIRTLL